MDKRLTDYFNILGVEYGASESEISKAFRALAQQFHPDSNDQPNAEEKFKEINEAYSVLNTPEKKYRYLGRLFLEKLEERDYPTSLKCLTVLSNEFPKDKWVISQKNHHAELSSRFERLHTQWREAFDTAQDATQRMSTRLREIKHANAIINSYNARELWPTVDHSRCLKLTADALFLLRKKTKKRNLVLFSAAAILLIGALWGLMNKSGSSSQNPDDRHGEIAIVLTATQTPYVETSPTPIPETATPLPSPTYSPPTMTPMLSVFPETPSPSITPVSPTDTPAIDTPTTLPTTTPTPEMIESRTRGTLYLTRPDTEQQVWSAFVRRGPGLDQERFTVVQRGDVFYILGEENGWYHIELQDGRIGYVSALLVRVLTP
ncbi:MAG: hypothetical protein C4527_17770 [Candidatus Omnitrophota bacterium]|jgi:hypothetical protein|nr:MAG: hypothetical protein C4527_17770 [Candidatus Omnitrophota bacterium]